MNWVKFFCVMRSFGIVLVFTFLYFNYKKKVREKRKKSAQKQKGKKTRVLETIGYDIYL